MDPHSTGDALYGLAVCCFTIYDYTVARRFTKLEAALKHTESLSLEELAIHYIASRRSFVGPLGLFYRNTYRNALRKKLSEQEYQEEDVARKAEELTPAPAIRIRRGKPHRLLTRR